MKIANTKRWHRAQDPGQQADESDGIHRFAPDLYGWAFLCDIIILIILLVDFNSFTSSDILEAGGVTTYFIYDKVPWSFVILLFGWFCDLIVERILYMIRVRKGKIGFHYIIMFLMHVVIFGYLPHYHQRSFNENHVAQVWYAIRCISFALSAHQIKYGYPDNVHGHACAKNYSFFHALVFKVYLAIPFLMEIRTLLGWACTKTCLSRSQWFQCEDIYARVYTAKYAKLKDKIADSPTSSREWLEAVLLFIFLILPIWTPLLLFSIYTEEADTNPPALATLTVSIGGYEPIFKSTATYNKSIRNLNQKELENLADLYKNQNRKAAQFIMGHEPEDVSHIDFDGLSLSNWDITPDSLQELKNDLSGEQNYKLWLDFNVMFRRKPDGKHYDELWGRYSVDLSQDKYKHVRQSLLDVISNGSDTPVEISDVFPRYLHVGRYAEVQPVNLLSQGSEKCSINVRLYSNNMTFAKWWHLGEKLNDSCHEDDKGTQDERPRVRIITFNDRINTDSTLSVMSRIGILSLYAGVVLALHRLIRGSITEDHTTLMFRQLEDFGPLIRLFSALHCMIELKNLPAQRRLYQLLIGVYADPARLREFTALRQQEHPPAE